MKRSKSKDFDIRKTKVDVRPLDQREYPLNSRKGTKKQFIENKPEVTITLPLWGVPVYGAKNSL